MIFHYIDNLGLGKGGLTERNILSSKLFDRNVIQNNFFTRTIEAERLGTTKNAPLTISRDFAVYIIM